MLSSDLILYSKCTVGLVQVVCAILLACGIMNIRRLIKMKGGQTDLDVKQLVQHSLAFGFYLLSLVILYGYYANYIYRGTEKAVDKYRVAFTISNAVSFASQLCLCSILWQFVKKEDERQEEE